ncbi:MAG: winged helix-turn-helix domain-containing protein [Candidatus Bathyarchaeia archaeon]|jgi:predicted transcriptional regulator
MGKLVTLSLTSPPEKTQNKRDLSVIVKSLEAECKGCSPISPLQCIDRCQAYKLKNELRTLQKALANPNYIKELFNALKNETRLSILQAMANGRFTVCQLQHKLKEAGQNHSQSTISKEYLSPLVAVGLASQVQEEYYATAFGLRVIQLLARFQEFARKLPAHSECYEETLLQALLSGPKTFEDIEPFILQKNVSRVLKRLCVARLIATPKERDYIFFFKSKRDPNQEKLTKTERKIYDAIANQGISVGNLAKETGLSTRITYKYLRHLKGKKLVFNRRTLKAYRLTRAGEKLALSMQVVQKIVEDAWISSELVMRDNR